MNTKRPKKNRIKKMRLILKLKLENICMTYLLCVVVNYMVCNIYILYCDCVFISLIVFWYLNELIHIRNNIHRVYQIIIRPKWTCQILEKNINLANIWQRNNLLSWICRWVDIIYEKICVADVHAYVYQFNYASSSALLNNPYVLQIRYEYMYTNT